VLISTVSSGYEVLATPFSPHQHTGMGLV